MMNEEKKRNEFGEFSDVDTSSIPILSSDSEYAVMIAARDHSSTTYIDGALVNQVTDSAWLHGQIGLNIWETRQTFVTKSPPASAVLRLVYRQEHP